MRVNITAKIDPPELNLRPAEEFAPSLAVPWLVRLRYGIIAGLAVLMLTASLIAHIKLHSVFIALLLLVMLASNALLQRLIDRFGARRALGYALSIDVLALTALFSFTGGPANPLTLLYLVQITLSAVALSRAWTWSLGIASILGFGFLFFFHIPLPALEGHHPAQGFAVHLYSMWIAFVAAALLITFFVGEVSESLRQHERKALLLQMQLSRHEKLTAIATLAAGAAHEMGSPLATIAVVAKDLELHAGRLETDAELGEEARLIRSEVDRCKRILQAMSANGAEFAGESQVVVNFRDFFADLLDTLPAETRDVIQAEADKDLKAVLPLETTRQVITALLRNALDANIHGRPVELRAEQVTRTLRLTIRDYGEGMKPEILKHLGEPFFTTKAPGRGMGLGAFLARVFAENLQGVLNYDSTFGTGTTVTLELPLVTNS